MTKPTAPASEPDCQAQLRALAAGDYSRFHGLSAACTRADADAALGAAAGDNAGNLGGSPTVYRTHPAGEGAPHGVIVWSVDERIVFVRIHDPAPRAPVAELLGEAELVIASRMRRSLEQHVWASRGLTLHIHRATGEVAFAMAYEPMTADAYRDSWIAESSMKRIPLRR